MAIIDSVNFTQQLKERLNIVDVISEYISLERRGRDYWACCPFHHEKTASFQVKAYHQYYICYGCHKSGDIINFVMEMDKISFGEAIEKLAAKAGMDMPERYSDTKYKKIKEKIEKIYDINREAAFFYHNNLKKLEGEIALEYLAERKITADTIKKFGIGYSTDYNSLVDYLKDKGYAIESMKDAGVIGITEDRRPYDFFAKRLIIPIISASGKVIGFTGRSLEKKTDHAKYKNTQATLAFNKGKNLFCLNMYKKHVPPSNRSMILVEGHMDAISLFQAGIKNVVASMGTALTIEQCKEIKKFADIVYVSYDGDSAGQNATLRGLSLLKNEKLEVRVVQLNDNMDPDDYVKKFGREGYLKLVDEAIPLTDFKLLKLEEKHKLDTYDGKVKYLKEAVEILAELDEMERAVYVETVSQKSGLSQERVFSVLQGQSAKINLSKDIINQREVNKIPPKDIDRNGTIIAQRYVIASMIFGKDYASYGDVNKTFFDKKGYADVLDYVEKSARDGQKPMASRLFDLLEKDEADAIIVALDTVKAENQASFYEQCVKKLYIRYLDSEIKNTVTELNNTADADKKNDLKKKLVTLTQMKK